MKEQETQESHIEDETQENECIIGLSYFLACLFCAQGKSKEDFLEQLASSYDLAAQDDFTSGVRDTKLDN